MVEQNTGKTPFLKNKKSQQLSKSELNAFRSYVIECGSQAEAGRLLNMTRQTVSLVFRFGTGSPETIKAIREALKATV